MLDFSASYFELFGIPERFEIDNELVAARYLALQQLVHPDRHANASAQQRLQALQEAGLVNEALRVLKDPLARASYMLTRRGVNPDTSAVVDPAFLMTQLELREALAEASSHPEPYRAIATILTQIQEQREARLKILACTLETEHLIEAQEALHKLQFLDRLRHSAEELEARLDEESAENATMIGGKAIA